MNNLLLEYIIEALLDEAGRKKKKGKAKKAAKKRSAKKGNKKSTRKKRSKKLSAKTRETLSKKAKNANMPLGALTAVYRKGLAAWLTGHRQGVPQHAWAMGRVNSFISGGKTRQVDKAEWEKVKKFRAKKK